MQPPYQPNVVNQTVSYGGKTWKGNPGSSWTEEVHPSGGNSTTPDATVATTNYQAGIGSAADTLRLAGTNLDTQYKGLLDKILGQGTVALNTVTRGENNLLAQRGITNNSPLYDAQMGSAQLPVQIANQTATSNLGFTEAGLQNTLAQNIANIQDGGAGTAAGLPLSYGSLALASAANIANISLAGSQAGQAGAQSRYIPTPYGLYDTSTQSFVSGQGNTTNGGGMVYKNGQWYLNVP